MFRCLELYYRFKLVIVYITINIPCRDVFVRQTMLSKIFGFYRFANPVALCLKWPSCSSVTLVLHSSKYEPSQNMHFRELWQT
jgi:hypothetical protein